MSTYNLAFLNSTNTTFELVTGVNTMSSGVLSITILMTTFIIILIALKNYDTKTALLADTFILTIIGTLMFFAGWIGWSVLGTIFAGLVGMMLVTYLTR